VTPSRPSSPADLLAAALRRGAAAPLVTFYDDVSSERTELSATTLANWVAKTANLLQEEFDAGPGSTVALALPVHWQTAAVLLGVWSCGAAVLETAGEDDDGFADADVVLAAAHRLPPLEEQELPELMGLSLHPMGLGMTGYTGPARDFALEVRARGDVFAPWQPVDPGRPGLLLGSGELTLGGLVATATELAGRLDLRSGDRVLIEEQAATEAGPVAWLLAPLAAGASMVLCRHPAASRLQHRAETERVTATLGVKLDGIRELGRPA
jgi:uncharacterized protein (TIGR03089 family)